MHIYMRPHPTPAVRECLLVGRRVSSSLYLHESASSHTFSAGQKQDPASGSNCWPAEMRRNTWFTGADTWCLLSASLEHADEEPSTGRVGGRR